MPPSIWRQSCYTPTHAKIIATELLKIFSRVGVPMTIITIQGTNFISHLLKEVCDLLKIKILGMYVYRLQIEDLVEWFYRTLKRMLKKCIAVDPCQWDQLIPPFYCLFERFPSHLVPIQTIPASSSSDP